MIDRCRADGDTVFLAFMDLTNAFPSTDRSTLWRKLYNHDARGPMLDWVRMLYDRMEYAVATGANAAECSERFRSMWGILAGDSASPGLFNFFISDFRPPPQKWDIIVHRKPISHLEQADDIALAARNHPPALQTLISYLHATWCATNFQTVNAKKSECMVMGVLPNPLPNFYVGNTILKIVDCFKYVGVTFTSTERCIFAQHYRQQASSARNSAYAILATLSLSGSFAIHETITFYMARVDPLLIFGCEAAIDVDMGLLAMLEDVQTMFLRRLLGLGDRSIRAPLFTETGVMPIRHRRLILAIKYLAYAVSLPESHYVKCAFNDSVNLWMAGKPCWLGDLQYALNALPHAIAFLPTRQLDATLFRALAEDVKSSCIFSLYTEITQSDKTVWLRLDTTTHMPTRLRPNPILATVRIPAHRTALMRLITSSHCLAIERLRWTERYRWRVPRAERICRFCADAVEDEVHAMFQCPAQNDLSHERDRFWDTVAHVAPDVYAKYRMGDKALFLHAALKTVSVLPALAALSFKVLRFFDLYEPRVPPQYRRPTVNNTGV